MELLDSKEREAALLAWQKRQALLDDPKRLRGDDFLRSLVQGFEPIRGDRTGHVDDKLLAGLGFLGEHPAVVASHVGAGMGPGGAGMRTLTRLLALGARFDLPWVFWLDVGADFQRDAGPFWPTLAPLMEALLTHPKPLVLVVCGQGLSGGAMALTVADHIIALEHAVLAPMGAEGANQVLWPGEDRIGEASRLLGGDVQALQACGLVNEVVLEGPKGATKRCDGVIERVGQAVVGALGRLASPSDPHMRLADRHRRYRKMGQGRSE